MQVGVFIPIGNNGWLLSETAPQYKPTFALNKAIAQKAEGYGLDFLLSMIKLRGFGGATEFWEYNLESFTLMAGLAAVTEKIKLFATAATLVTPPAIAARMASTIDSISGGRFGLNLITGWQRPEYDQMGLWPGDEHFRHRYDMLAEYAQVLRELWATGTSNLKGQYYTMDDCRVRPIPEGEMKIICAGSSEEGLAFSAKYADYAFCLGKGLNTPTAFSSINDRLALATAKTGRDVSVFVLVMIIAEETDEAAMAKWEHYKAGADQGAIAWLGGTGRSRQDLDHHQRAPAGRSHLCREPEHGHVGRILRQSGGHAGRDRRSAGRRRRAPHLRRFPGRRRQVRPMHPAVDEKPALTDFSRKPVRFARRHPN